MICSSGEERGCGHLLSQPPVGLIIVWVRAFGCRKAGGGGGKGLGSREAGFDAGKGRGSTRKRRSGVLMAARVTWEMMKWPP